MVGYLQRSCYDSSLRIHAPGLGHMTCLDQQNAVEGMVCEPNSQEVLQRVLLYSGN